MIDLNYFNYRIFLFVYLPDLNQLHPSFPKNRGLVEINLNHQLRKKLNKYIVLSLLRNVLFGKYLSVGKGLTEAPFYYKISNEIHIYNTDHEDYNKITLTTNTNDAENFKNWLEDNGFNVEITK